MCSSEQYCKDEGINHSAFCFWLKYINQEDKFTYYQSFASEYLRRAKKALELLEYYIDIDRRLRMPLMREAIISYAALFAQSKGRVSTRWRLDEDFFIPQQLQDVHK